MQAVTKHAEPLELLRVTLRRCLDLADSLDLDMVAPHIDLAIARLDEAAESASRPQDVNSASVVEAG